MVVGLLLCVSWILNVGPGFCFGMTVLVRLVDVGWVWISRMRLGGVV